MDASTAAVTETGTKVAKVVHIAAGTAIYEVLQQHVLRSSMYYTVHIQYCACTTPGPEQWNPTRVGLTV